MPKRSDQVKYEELHNQVFPMLAGAVDGGADLSLEEQAHAETCLKCQAELLRYRKMLRTLHDLRTTVIHPAPGLLAEILDNLAERGEQHAIRSILSGRRVAYAGGIAVATVAGVTGVILLAGHNRGLSKSKSAKKAA